MTDALTTGADRLASVMNEGMDDFVLEQTPNFASDTIATDPGVKALVEYATARPCLCESHESPVKCARCAALKLWETG